MVKSQSNCENLALNIYSYKYINVIHVLIFDYYRKWSTSSVSRDPRYFSLVVCNCSDLDSMHATAVHNALHGNRYGNRHAMQHVHQAHVCQMHAYNNILAVLEFTLYTFFTDYLHSFSSKIISNFFFKLILKIVS